MDKKPLFDSDADPKRIKKVADGLRRQGEFESARMLDGYADLLEAREKAQPVGMLRIGADASNQYGKTAAFHYADACMDLSLGDHEVFPHPAPSDSERLAEALRKIVEWQPPYVMSSNGGRSSMQAEFGSNGVRDYFRRIAEEALAAHHAQAQPPAASATPNLASYWRIVAEAAEVLQMVLDSGVKLPPNWRWPLLDELSGLSAMMLAAQENPNG